MSKSGNFTDVFKARTKKPLISATAFGEGEESVGNTKGEGTNVAVENSAVASEKTSTHSSSSAAADEVPRVINSPNSSCHPVLSSATSPPSDLNMSSPSQPRMTKYPSLAGSRSFNSNWYKGRPWLEYSVEKDSAFCFPCRVFGVYNSSTNTATFTEDGYKDWKHALEGWNLIDTIETFPENKRKMKGFAKHVTSTCHIDNFSAWKEKEMRDAEGMTIQSIVGKLDTDSRKWVEVIFHVIRYLAAEGLPFRGDDESHDFEKGLSGGLFLDTMQNLVFELKPEIRALAKRMQRNAVFII